VSQSNCGRHAESKYHAFKQELGQVSIFGRISYNNSYQASLKMAPFEALYGRRCRTPLNWSEAGERTLFGPDLVKDAEEKVKVIRENFKLAQVRQKSYHDKGIAPNTMKWVILYTSRFH
jgi:hypothetical protein